MTSEDFLAHYGVKGMKWGVRKDGVSGQSGGGAPKILSKKVGGGEQPPVGSLVAAASIITLYGAIGTKSLVEQGSFTSASTRGKAFMRGDPKGLYKKNEKLADPDYSADDILKHVIPGINPKYGAWGTNMNCRRTTLAYEMRRRGLDVQATRTSTASGQTAAGLAKATGKKKGAFLVDHDELGTNALSSNRKEIFDTLAKQPDGSRGEFAVSWKGPQPGTPGGGHSMAYEVIKGKPHIFDAQNGQEHKNSSSNLMFDNIEKAAFTRLDDAQLNEKRLARWVR